MSGLIKVCPFSDACKNARQLWLFSGGKIFTSDGWNRRLKLVLNSNTSWIAWKNRVGRSHMKFQALLLNMKSE
jgi:streptogramin lyase